MNSGAFGENFPYSNFHDLNMDWIIKIAKDFLDQYTHIQEIIENGEQSLQDLTTSGLAQLQDKADNLEALLQAWYNTHSEDIANQLASALNDLNSWYTEHQNFLNEYLTTAINTFNASATTKGNQVLDSIPSDYSDLQKQVSGLSSGIVEFPKALNYDDTNIYPDIEQGVYVDPTDGFTKNVDPNYSMSDFIWVEPGSVVTRHHTSDGTYLYMYTQDMEYIEEVHGLGQYIIPDNCYIIRSCIQDANPTDFYFTVTNPNSELNHLETIFEYLKNGENNFNIDVNDCFAGFLNPSDGKTEGADPNYYTTDYIPIYEYYTLDRENLGSSGYTYFYDINKNYLGEKHTSTIYLMEQNVAFTRICFRSNISNPHFSIRAKILDDNRLYHFIVLGQSLSLGYGSSPALSAINSSKCKMFKHIRTYDFGYIFGITQSSYNANQETYDEQFYEVNDLEEEGGYGTSETAWEDASYNEYETQCTGIALGLQYEYRKDGYSDIPFDCLFTASGVGGASITDLDNNIKFQTRTYRDIRHAYNYAKSLSKEYTPVIVWVQGENDMQTDVSTYKSKFLSLYNKISNELAKYKCYNTPVFSYQTTNDPSGYYPTGTKSSIAQEELNSENNFFYITYPIYNLPRTADYVHLTNESSRRLGISIGKAIHDYIEGNFSDLRIISAEYNSTLGKVMVKMNKPFIFDNGGALFPSDNWGFHCYDANGNNVMTAISSDSDYIYITCSAQPETLAYAIESPTSRTIGGGIREAEIMYTTLATKLFMTATIMPITLQQNF